MFKIISPNDGYHYFFGYYDLVASQGNDHLAHRVPFMDRLPEVDDVAELGILRDGEFLPFAKTTAWNFQQGALLQYHPTLPDTVIYNVNEGGFKTVTHNLKTGEKIYTDRACASISPDGKYGLGIDFGSIFEFRPGYGYAGAPVTEDGVWLVNMDGSGSRQIVTQDALYDTGFDRSERLLVNHITFNPDSTKFLMLVRNFPEPGKRWGTSLVTVHLDGSMKTILKPTTVSHYYWLDADNIVVVCKIDKERLDLYKVNMETGEYSCYDFGRWDIHCIITPDRRYIIGDGYPTPANNMTRALWSINLETGEIKTVFAVPEVTPDSTDMRCDLHARFAFDGKVISFDTTQNGKREIATVPIEILDN